MKKILSLILACCVLFSCACAATMEDVLLKAPELLLRAFEGFDLEISDADSRHAYALAQDGDGKPLFLWASGGPEGENASGSALRLETLAEAFLYYSLGEQTLPAFSEEDVQFVPEMAEALTAAVLSGVSVTETDAERENGETIHQTGVLVSPQKILSAVDAAMQEQLAKHAEPISRLLEKTAQLSSEPGPVPTAADLLAMWKQAGLSALLPADIPFELTISSAPSGSWSAEAAMAGISLRLAFTGEHLTAALNTWQKQYVFDTRDLVMLGDLLAGAWRQIPPEVLNLTLTADGMSFRFDPERFLQAFHSALTAAVRQTDEAGHLLSRYLPWFGVTETDPALLRQMVCEGLDALFLSLNSMGLPSVEADFTASADLIALETLVNGSAGYIRVRKDSFDMLFGALRANGVLHENGFSAKVSAGETEYAANGQFVSDQLGITVSRNGRPVSDITVSPSGIRIADSADPETFLSIRWDGDLLLLTAAGGATSFTFEAANDHLTAEYQAARSGEPGGARVYTHRADLNWSAADPHMDLCYRADRSEGAADTVYELNCAPGSLKGTFDDVSFLLTGEGDPDTTDCRLGLTVARGEQSKSWTADVNIYADYMEADVTGDNAFSFWFDTGSLQMTDEDLSSLNFPVTILTRDDVLDLLGLTPPAP